MYDKFDKDELLAFAVKSIGDKNYIEALAYTKSILNNEPSDEKARFLLASIHAQLGLFDKAVIELEALCDDDCTIPECFYQLGLLYFTTNNIDKAKQSWSKLDRFKSHHFLVSFRNALIAFNEGEYASCIDHIDEGIKNSLNQSLNTDLLKIKTMAENHLNEQNSEDISESTSDNKKHLFLNAYKDS